MNAASLGAAFAAAGAGSGSVTRTHIVAIRGSKLESASAADVGPLCAARFTEAMGFPWTAAAFQGGAGEMIAFRAVLPD